MQNLLGRVGQQQLGGWDPTNAEVRDGALSPPSGSYRLSCTKINSNSLFLTQARNVQNILPVRGF
jgi:hypothetical protein